MPAESEAAADILTGAVVAATVEPRTGEPAAEAEQTDTRRACLNCGAKLTGAYCASCGQAAHVHRSFVSIGHDVLHSVFHFDNKFWRTMPELALHPGRLTRRYIDGERAKFISPMALFLFTVFLMYGVFALVPSEGTNSAPPFPGAPATIADLQQDNREAAAFVEQRIEDLRGNLDDSTLPAQERAELEREIRGLERSRQIMQAIADGDWGRIAELEESAGATEAAGADTADAPASADPQGRAARTPADAPRNPFERVVAKIEEDPALVLYKVKSNGYKFSWLLVLLSIPFMWLLFFWRREFRLYDHAVFVTYSISFMTLLVIAGQLTAWAGASGGVQAALTMLLPPVHIYKQLRGAYGLSRRGAAVRLVFVLIAAMLVLSFFFAMLFVIGALE